MQPLEFRIAVRPSPSTSDHEVLLQGDGHDLVALFDDSLMGLDPDDILVEPCQLRADETPHSALIARCVCGIIGCGSVEVEIRREGAHVVWKSARSPRQIRFLANQYHAELERALHDFSWETPDRTAARHVRNSVNNEDLVRRGYKFEWASSRVRPGKMTVSLEHTPGPYQVLVSLPWDGRDRAIAAQFARVLAGPSSSWPELESYPQRPHLR